MDKHFLSCDWGTSNFRLRLVSSEDLQVLDEATSDQGVGELSKAWQAKGSGNEEERTRFYMDVLREHVAALKSRSGISLDGARIIISGMASSTIGLINLPYEALPVPTDGSGLSTHTYEPDESFPHPVLIISGLRSDDDVMRGEETQLIGCLSQEMVAYSGPQLIVHPGTHSKHMTIENGRITGFRTYMSGEFFKLLSTHGILRDNVKINPFRDEARQAFEKGVADSVGVPLLHAAFKVRTNDLFGALSKEDNYHYLSGLLIGSELQELSLEPHARKFLCCGPGLFRQYSLALHTLALDATMEIFPPEWEEGAVVRGHAKVLKHLGAGISMST